MRVWVLLCGLLAVAALSGQTRVDLKNQAKTPDFSQSGATKPAQTGSALPASCTTGEQFLLTTAAAGQNLYLCMSGNTWTTVRADLSPATGQAAGKVLTSNSTDSTWQSLGGDLSGTPGTVQVVGMRGRAIGTTIPTDGDALRWDQATQRWDAVGMTVTFTPGLGVMLSGSTVGIDDTMIPQYATGVGAPVGSCTPGRDLYVDFTYQTLYACVQPDAWQAVSMFGHVHSASDVTSGILSSQRLPALSGDVASTSGSAALTVTGLQGHPVSAAAPADGQSLRWDAVASQWSPGAFAASIHTHDAGDITSGTLGLVRGGTNQSTWTGGRCVRVSDDGTRLESAPGACSTAQPSTTGAYATLTAMPCTAANTGLTGLPTDSVYEQLRCNGAGTWEAFAGGRLLMPPPQNGWTWVNQGTAAAADGGGLVGLTAPANGATAVQLRVRPQASGPYQWITRLHPAVGRTGNMCGVALYQNALQRTLLFGPAAASDTGAAQLSIQYFSNANTKVSTAYDSPQTAVSGPTTWLRVDDTGAQFVFWSSADGMNWLEVYREARTARLGGAADNIGFGCDAEHATAGAIMTVSHWQIQ